MLLLALACKNEPFDSSSGPDSSCPVVALYVDADGDGHGSEQTVQACVGDAGTAEQSGDCDDGSARVFPGAPEEDCADPVDYNCDGSVGYADADADGWAACQDCDDAAAWISPDAVEVCDGEDNDCDGAVDDADDSLDKATATAWYPDADGDGFVERTTPVFACEQPSGFAQETAWDCDDAADDVYPGAEEACDGVDHDCDGLVYEDESVDADEWWPDADGDGHGAWTGTTVFACSQPSGYAATETDCDDGDSTVYEGAVELCDGVDNDCDNTDDEGVLGTGGACPADDCLAVLADNPSATDGTYTLHGYTVRCEMDIDGGGWTQLTSSHLATLSTSTNRSYLYSYGSAFYISPATTLVWSWSSYQVLTGSYRYGTGTTATGSFSCSHGEAGHRGVGCSNGPGGQWKVLPWGGSSNTTTGTTQICQDQPGLFGGACRAGVQIWVR